MYASVRLVVRWVKPDPIAAGSLGDAEDSMEVTDWVNQGEWIILASPWEEDAIIEDAVRGYKMVPRDNHQVVKMTRGSHSIGVGVRT